MQPIFSKSETQSESLREKSTLDIADPKEAGPQLPFEKQSQDWPGIEGKMNPLPDFGLKTYKGLGRLKDQIALVTGGDSGIGRAVCLAYAREGADVVCGYYNEHEDAKETEKAVTESGRKCELIASDLSTEEGCKAVIDAAIKKFGRIDILVNNAAFQGKAVDKFEDLTWDRVEYTFRTNILSMFALVRLALPHMKPGGSIINVGSIQAYDPSLSILDYASTKGAIVAFTKGLAPHVMERGIRANCVAPGPVWTPLVVSSFPPEKNAEFGKKYPHKRPAQPVELSPAFVFLASQEARYVNGEVLGVTGGAPLA